MDGIDAPETDQVCLDQKEQVWPCGLAARDRLATKVAGQKLTCVTSGTDRYGRSLAGCRLDSEDIQSWLVRQGLALSFTRYSHAYDGDEDKARRSKVGMWAGSFIAPWDWRSRG